MVHKSNKAYVCLNAVLFVFITCAGSANAATLCVGPFGSGCMTTIGAAIAAANAGDNIQVQQGVYSEKVVINKPLSLVGSGDGGTIVSAWGLNNGIVVDGSATANGLTGVVVSGMTIENANFEGILVRNASSVTVINNRVINNNMALNTANTPFACAGLMSAAPYEVNEGADCGQGLHLIAVDHSTVANNLVQNNAGGILLSDETGASHDNLIAGNNVNGNAFAGGITLLSSAPYSATTLTAPAGVYHNTISGNAISANGAQSQTAGAGVAMLALAPQSRVSDNVVNNNQIASNMLPGFVLHTLTSQDPQLGLRLNGNVVIGNKIIGNGADVGSAATTGATGINIYSAVATDMQISQNVFSAENINVAVNAPGATIQVHLNDFAGATGIVNTSTATIDGAQNWWGCSAGPGNGGCASLQGPAAAAVWSSNPF